MKTHTLKIVVTTVLIAGVFSAFQLGWESPPKDELANSGIGDVRNLLAAYDQWKANYTRTGGDKKLVLPLGYSKGLSAKFTKSHGQATLDLINGTVSVEVWGLPGEEGFDVWLIDNRPGPGHNVRPEPGDAMVRIGRLKHQEGTATLQTQLEPETTMGFELDLVVVASVGDDPGASGLLFGSPSIFHRLYYNEHRGQFVSLGEVYVERSLFPTPFSVLIPSPVYAHKKTGNQNPESHLESLIAKGEVIFFNEEFNGNGRTCGTCHPAENNFTIDPAFIATLPNNDPLFVAEFIDALNFEKNGGKFFENPVLMRALGLIVENQDGFNDLENNFNMRGVPHTLALPTSLTPAPGGADGTTVPPTQRTGWSGDGAPGSGTLREFAIGAIIQHFPKTLARDENGNPPDFRLPTEKELDAMEAFQLSLGRQDELDLDTLELKSEVARKGQEIFRTNGKCDFCHANAGANASFIPGGFNFNFNTGVEDLPDQPADLTDELVPSDDGFGTPGNGTFNTPTVVEAADTGPFFHNNAITTIEGAVAFYNSDAFNNSPSAQIIGGIDLEPTQVEAVAAFLRVINAMENIRSSKQHDTRAMQKARYFKRHNANVNRLLTLSREETKDAIGVLQEVGLHLDAVEFLKEARGHLKKAIQARFRHKKIALIRQAIAEKRAAQELMRR